MADISDFVYYDVLDFCLLLTAILGFVGNFFSFKVFSSSSLRKNPISIFFCVISIFDSIMLINVFFYSIWHQYSIALEKTSDFICKFKDYFFYATGPISPWLMVVISIDRFICIRFPKKFPFLFKRPYQIAIICAVISYNYIFYSCITWNTQLKECKQAILNQEL